MGRGFLGGSHLNHDTVLGSFCEKAKMQFKRRRPGEMLQSNVCQFKGYTALMVVAALTFGFFYASYAVNTSVSCIAGVLCLVVPGGRVLYVQSDPSHESSYC